MRIAGPKNSRLYLHGKVASVSGAHVGQRQQHIGPVGLMRSRWSEIATLQWPWSARQCWSELVSSAHFERIWLRTRRTRGAELDWSCWALKWEAGGPRRLLTSCLLWRGLRFVTSGGAPESWFRRWCVLLGCAAAKAFRHVHPVRCRWSDPICARGHP